MCRAQCKGAIECVGVESEHGAAGPRLEWVNREHRDKQISLDAKWIIAACARVDLSLLARRHHPRLDQNATQHIAPGNIAYGCIKLPIHDGPDELRYAGRFVVQVLCREAPWPQSHFLP